MLDKYSESFVLVSGLGSILEVANFYGYKKAIEIEELLALYPALNPSVNS